MGGTVESQTQAMIDNLPVKTGKPLVDWFAIVRESSLDKHGMIIKLLTDDYKISYGFANLIATLYRQQQSGGPPTGHDLVEEQYKGVKAALQPLYASVLNAIQAFGDDVEIAPKKTYVSLRRHKQFAVVQPSTRTRLDIGLNVNDVSATSRLVAGNIFNGMCNHLVQVTSLEEIDSELIGWLKKAYEQA